MREQPLGLAIGERGRRLVEDQHREVGAERLGDLDHLLLGAGEILDPLARPQRKAEPLEDLVGAAVQLATCRESRGCVSSAPRNRFSSTVSVGTSENSWNTALMPSVRA